MSVTKLSKTLFLFATITLASFAMLAALVQPAEAAARKCFGKKVNRVITGNNKKVKLKFKDVTWVAGDKVTVIGKPYSRICADKGRQIVYPGKGRTWTSTGADDDKIFLHRSSNKNVVQAGLGDDVVRGSKGHDFIYASPKSNPKGLSDRDDIDGLGGNDRIFDYSGDGNVLKGNSGSDRIYSVGNSVSTVFGGKGTDFIYSNGGRSASGRLEQLYGENGNDRLLADRLPNNGPVYLDGGPGDDWMNGTPQDDVILFHFGIKKIKAGAGDDFLLTSSRASATVDGGAGRDRLSFAAHTPPGYRKTSGVYVNLAQGYAVGSRGRNQLSDIEVVTGSAFDDEIIGRPGQREWLEGGLGDDTLVGQYQDEDEADGGLGQNDCQGIRLQKSCGQASPGTNDHRRTIVDIDEAGVLVVVGSNGEDDIKVGYDAASSSYTVKTGSPAIPSGICTTPSKEADTTFTCPVDRYRMNGMLIYGNRGSDRIKIEDTVPALVTTTINAGTGKSVVEGGRSNDNIYTEEGSAGSVLRGNGGNDVIWMWDDVTAEGGPGHDAIHAPRSCDGGYASGGPGTDPIVFVGSPRGVEADLGKGYAKLIGGSCRKPLTIAPDVEKIEGTIHDDHLILGKRHRTQEGKSGLLGRGGIDILNSKNGRRDTVTTGDNKHKNKVIADKKDKVIWGWGLAAY